MLATVLKGDLAIRQSIEIMRTFKTMRSIILNNSEFIANQNLLLYLNKQKELESQINDIKQSMILYTYMDLNSSWKIAAFRLLPGTA